ncbi:MAG: asparagine synthase C-terminal domain-containing protein, partial [Candidatus Calescibacterium sp.]|nr:asparagine synthase C-terminal domain-containing protein [Candidatus Calescibacterium sp.]
NFTFASEVKSILVYRGWNFKLDNSSLLEYLTFQNFLSNKTLYKDIFILEPSKYIEIDLLKRNFYIRDYWDFDFISLVDFSLNKNAAIDELSVIMESAVKRQMVSDVEVGSYLSGGIDTGILVAFASKLFKSNTLKTFTIGFDMTSVSGLELSFDERDKAEYMSYLFSTEHYEMVLKAGDMERCFEKLVYHLEEPRVGQSYPNFYASKLASKFVKVVLSGTGGDELFGGYPWRYHSFAQAKSFEEFIDSYYSYWHRLVDPNYFRRIFEQMIKEVGEDYTRDIFVSILKKQFSSMCNKKLDYDTMLLMAFYFEVKTFLHGLLIIEDKLSMAHGLEVRVPFLDNEVINLALRIPAFLKLSSFKNVDVFDNEIKQKAEVVNGKYILRLLANRLIGSKISELKKQGFTAPDTSWFKGESIEFVKKKLLNPKARIYNLMSRKHVKDVLEEHFTGRKNRRLFIWSLLYLEYWLKIYCNL